MIYQLLCKNIQIKYAVEEGISFYKLIIKIKKEIVAYNIPQSEYDLNKVGEHLNYKESKRFLINNGFKNDFKIRESSLDLSKTDLDESEKPKQPTAPPEEEEPVPEDDIPVEE